MKFYAPLARVASGWASNVLLSVDDTGAIAALETNTARDRANQQDVVQLSGPIVAGMPNSHSHAFQRLMAGRAEWRANQTDSFWSWRDVMYRTASTISPEQMCEVATHLYIEMLRAGYTHVCEFHYLHHAPDGTSYAPSSAMADALIEAAQNAGITLTLLPTLYMTGGFDGRTLNDIQRRFYHQLDDFTHFVEHLGTKASHTLNVGVACHSLRAVPSQAVHHVLDFIRQWNPQAPFHMHISEQLKEVEEALEFLGSRPVEWLLENATLPEHSCLVHSTHVTETELSALAASNAVISICTTTEANLGDGVFALQSFLNQAGQIAIGSDSQISVSPIEELRWLEYSQRLATHQRNVAATLDAPNTGDVLWQKAVSGGAKAAGRKRAGLTVGAPADFLVLSACELEAVIEQPQQILDSLVFSGNRQWIDQVYVRGRQVVDHDEHSQQHQAQRYFNQIAKQLRLT